jgi:hypothetical protein
LDAIAYHRSTSGPCRPALSVPELQAQRAPSCGERLELALVALLQAGVLRKELMPLGVAALTRIDRAEARDERLLDGARGTQRNGSPGVGARS